MNEAFKHRYAGRLRSAKGSLLELTQRPGQSVWHRKAHALLMDSDSILMQLVNGLVGPGFVGGMGVGIVEAYETLKRRRMSEKTSALECEQLKARRCSGPLKNDDECALAHQGDAALCAAVLQSLDIQ